jgi:integrase
MPIRLVRRPKSPYWIARGSLRGIRIEESTGIVDDGRAASKRQAEEIRAKREAEIIEQSVHGRRVSETFAGAVVSYLEAGGSKRFLDRVLEHFGSTPLARIDQDAIDRGARKVYPNASDATRNRQFYTPVSAVLTHGAGRGWCDSPLIERPRGTPGRVRFLEPSEAERLIAACGPHLRPLVIFLFNTGARIGEAIWLDWQNVDLARGQVVFVKTKNGDRRGVPLNPRIVATLAALPHRDGEVFRRPDGLPYEPLKGDDSDTSAGGRIKTAFGGAVRRAGIEEFHPHDCRHTWATWHYRVNRDLGALMKIGGWKTVSMVMRYAHTNVAEHAATMAALPGGNGGDIVIAEGKVA